jgi:hypothetical protein
MDHNSAGPEVLVASLGTRSFTIEREAGLGFHLNVYEGQISVADHLQDTLDQVMEQAEEEYSVPRTAWRAYS